MRFEHRGEGPWHAPGAARGLPQLLGWPKPQLNSRFQRYRGLLIYLIHSINRHDGFCHLLAIVVKSLLRDAGN